ncbi:MAG TPA: GNAT family N-acetyltransferase [Roseivirga sp.]
MIKNPVETENLEPFGTQFFDHEYPTYMKTSLDSVMNVDFHIRMAKISDAEDMLEIYGPIVTNTATSFETEIPSNEAFQNRISSYGSKAPWLVAVIDNKVIGYAYATEHRSRKAYQWNQEVTVYVHHEHRKKGIARELYTKLFEMLKAMNFTKAIAVITLPNDASISFHKALGFQHIGEMKNIGFKLGQWRSTSWWDIQLNHHEKAPLSLKTLDSILDSFDMRM